MISIIVCHKDKKHLEEFKDSLKKTIGVEYELIVIDNTRSKYYLTKAYNTGVQKSNGEFLVFVHEDVRFETNNWGRVLINIFKNNDKAGVIGVAGSNILLQNAQWWFPGKDHMFGKVIHESNGKIWKSIFSENKGDHEVVVLDGVFMACKKNILNKENIQWDEDFDNFHFYDLSFCIPFIQKGYKNYVTYNISIRHFGMGTITPEWEHYRHVFVNKFLNILPLKTNQSVEFDGKRKNWDTEIIYEP